MKKTSVRIMSDNALRMALDALRRTGAWPERRNDLGNELQRRNKIRRNKPEQKNEP